MAAGLEESEYEIGLTNLYGRADALRAEYLAAKPWPHVVIRDAFPQELLVAAEKECTSLDESKLVTSHEDRQIKQETPDLLGPACRRVLEIVDGPEFSGFMSTVTGVQDLLADPTHKLAGVHRTPPGGFTKIHRDFRLHPVTGNFHRVNLLIYLNQDWDDSYGGNLELWPSDMSGVGRSVSPVINTMVLWETDDQTLHGLPDPMTCPPDRMRVSIAAYYYTKEPRPDREERRVVGYWEARPDDDPAVGRLTWQDKVRGLTPRPVRKIGRTLRKLPKEISGS